MLVIHDSSTSADGSCFPVVQAQLLDSLFGTERGMSASSEVRAEINELITQLEAKSPDSDLTEVCRGFHPSLPRCKTLLGKGCSFAFVRTHRHWPSGP